MMVGTPVYYLIEGIIDRWERAMNGDVERAPVQFWKLIEGIQDHWRQTLGEVQQLRSAMQAALALATRDGPAENRLENVIELVKKALSR